jgi:hypothetical protein
MAVQISNNLLKNKLEDLGNKIDGLSSKFEEHLKQEAEREARVTENRVLLIGDGKDIIGVVNQLRDLLKFQSSLDKWLTIIGVAFVGQLVAIIAGITIFVIQALPILNKLVTEAPNLIK